MILLGLAGQARAGKNTVADFLVETYDFVSVAFADQIKRQVRSLYGFTPEQLWGSSENRDIPDVRYVRERHARHDWVENDDGSWTCVRCCFCQRTAEPECVVYLTPRFALQTHGDAGRVCDPNIWIRKLSEVVLAVSSGASYSPFSGIGGKAKKAVKGIVVTDARMSAELEALRLLGGKLIKLSRPGEGLKGDAGQHPTERSVSKVDDSFFDAILLNDKDVPTLHARAAVSVEALL